MKIDGGCHCGHVTYEAEIDPERVAICHCSDCQTLSASAFRTIVPVVGDRLTLLGGQPAVYVKTAESGNRREQAFCPRCGTGIYAAAAGDGPKGYNLRVGSIRQRDELPPKSQKWTAARQAWLADLATLPGIETQ